LKWKRKRAVAAAAAASQQSNNLEGRGATEERVEELRRRGRGGGGEDAIDNSWDGVGREGAEAALEGGDLTLGRRRHGGSLKLGLGMTRAGERDQQNPNERGFGVSGPDFFFGYIERKSLRSP